MKTIRLPTSVPRVAGGVVVAPEVLGADRREHGEAEDREPAGAHALDARNVLAAAR